MDDLHRRLLSELFTARLGVEVTLELALVGASPITPWWSAAAFDTS